MIPKSMAVESPTADEIFEVSKSLSLQPVLENTKKMPSHIWERPGRVLVIKEDKKLKILKEISAALQKKRSQTRKQ
jgi:signal recognition particle subunit SEC65